MWFLDQAKPDSSSGIYVNFHHATITLEFTLGCHAERGRFVKSSEETSTKASVCVFKKGAEADRILRAEFNIVLWIHNTLLFSAN